MPLMLSGDRSPARWAPEKSWQALGSRDRDYARAECIQIALVNNMPDAALEDTEVQFHELLAAAAGDIPVCVRLYSLPEICRNERARQHMDGLYLGINDLFDGRFDALIVTGTEPRQRDLQSEPYWRSLVNILEWAEQNTASAILSCLAAHASVLHSDGIERQLLDDKRFGVFDERRVSPHLLTASASNTIRIPHSRWNELREDDLTSRGYVVLTKSKEAGVGLFAKQKRTSLFVYIQGHPEYGTQTLLKEYRRDIKRFFRKEREAFPSMPCGYFGAAATKLLCDFREQALLDPREGILAAFPDCLVAETLQNDWHSSGAHIYRNWLRYVASRKADGSAFETVHPDGRFFINRELA
ncbi:MAG: homoserine O-succinyltransferase MetA [Candidatus Acidiferrales bacterium]